LLGTHPILPWWRLAPHYLCDQAGRRARGRYNPPVEKGPTRHPVRRAPDLPDLYRGTWGKSCTNEDAS